MESTITILLKDYS